VEEEEEEEEDMMQDDNDDNDDDSDGGEGRDIIRSYTSRFFARMRQQGSL